MFSGLIIYFNKKLEKREKPELTQMLLSANRQLETSLAKKMQTITKEIYLSNKLFSTFVFLLWGAVNYPSLDKRCMFLAETKGG